jgi:hypothetical protein
MSASNGNSTRWRALGRAVDGEELEDTFSGSRAYRLACELLDFLKDEADVMEVALLRLDGNVWICIERLRRNDLGDWAELPFGSG